MIKEYKYYFTKSKRDIKKEYKNLPSTILNKPFVENNNYHSVPEIIILKLLCEEHKLQGFWVDAFHKKIRYSLNDYKNINDLPIKIRDKINIIKQNNNNSIYGCWDLILYDYVSNIKFVEIKGIPSRDKEISNTLV